MRTGHLQRWWPVAAAIVAPAALTAVLVAVNPENNRDYVFLYVAIVALLGVSAGLTGALVAAATSFLLVDYFFVTPVHTFDVAQGPDLVNLVVFFGAAGLVGTVGSRRRAAQLHAEQLATELRAANRELERLAETERYARDLEETDRVRREVLANVSHELRTPLGGVLTGVTSLQRRDGISEQSRAEIQSIADSARRLDHLVSELLDMTRIEGGVVDTRADELDVHEIVESAVARHRRTAPESRVDIEIEDPIPDVVADWDRVGQVLDNLLDNAAHVAAGAAIRVAAQTCPAGEIRFTVSDQGPGVPVAMRERIFERFVRGPSSTYPGAGLGLSIVKGLVEAQHGRVWVEDGPSASGAAFSFTLPAVAGESADD